ncbi:MAG: Ig-like domain-containing protein [Chloroflexota bacterium]|nr:MAG: hypothetical protein DLM70_16010 [Chloroflexota bacterium]
MSRLNRLVLAVIVGLALTIGVLSAASARLGPTVDSMNTVQELDGASVNTPIQVNFTEPMNVSSVRRSFRLTPRAVGQYTWSGNQLLFQPRKPLAYSHRYTVTIGSGAASAKGKTLFRTFRASFTTQSQHLMYLGTEGDERNRLVMASVDGEKRVMGPDDGLITDYSVSQDRTLVVFAKRPSPRAHVNEIWLLSLVDGSTQRIFTHADWDISEPHLSPDDRSVVFLATNVLLCQPYYPCARDKTGPVIFLLTVRSHKAKQFQPRSSAPLTYFIDFSPAAQIAYTDLSSALTLASIDGQSVTHVPNLNNSLEYSGFDESGDKAAFVGSTPSSSGGDILVYRSKGYVDVSRGVYDSSTPAFSSSGQQIAYSGYHGELGIEPVYGINMYSFTTHHTRRLTNDRAWSDWAPSWSTDDRYVAFVRSQPQEAMYMGSGEIWVIRSDGRGGHSLGSVGKSLRWIS